MSTDVTVLRVFTDAQGGFGNSLGVVDASTVAPADRQTLATRLGYSETIFIDLPPTGTTTAHAQIFDPMAELPFAGHPTVGASWWLREQGMPVIALQVPAGMVAVSYDGDLAIVRARAHWGRECTLHDMGSPESVTNADPADFVD